MKRRDEDDGQPFLTRTADQWARIGERADPRLLAGLLGFAGAVLAGAGELSRYEVDRLLAIAAGSEEHPRIDANKAQAILSGWPAERS